MSSTDELTAHLVKSVRCMCGGEPYRQIGVHQRIVCLACDIRGPESALGSEAVAGWNALMEPHHEKA